MNRIQRRRALSAGALSNTRHPFREGLALAKRAARLAPDLALVYGVMGDAFVELGRHEAGFRAYERMASLKPSIAAYGRVAQARSLLGDTAGAKEAVTLALDSAVDANTGVGYWSSASRAGELRFEAAAVSSPCTRRVARNPSHSRLCQTERLVTSRPRDRAPSIGGRPPLLTRFAALSSPSTRRRNRSLDGPTTWLPARAVAMNGVDTDLDRRCSSSTRIAYRLLTLAACLHEGPEWRRGGPFVALVGTALR